jgi:hypothetical protein
VSLDGIGSERVINRNKSTWGKIFTGSKLVSFLISFLIRCIQTDLFSRPERWANIPDDAASVPGLGACANIMSFVGGPRACIGY